MTGIEKARACVVAACLVGALGLGSGCDKDKSDGTPPTPKLVVGPPGGGTPEEIFAKLPGGDEFAAAKKIYASNKCANCHKLGDTGGGMMAGGLAGQPPGAATGGPPGPAPDLTKVGAAPEHTKPWLSEHIRDAKKHTPKSRMPAFPPEQIGDGDLEALVEYLASRK